MKFGPLPLNVFRYLLPLLVSALMLPVTGCTVGGAGGGDLAVRSASDQDVILRGDFDTVMYDFEDKNTVTVILLDGPAESPRQAATIRMFWKPRAGRTPIDANATNATVHYIIFTGEQVGVYSGAGYVFPKQTPGGSGLGLSVWNANLLLTDQSDQFNDLLGQALLRGNLSARRDDATTQRVLKNLNMLIRERLGYPRLVGEPAQLPDS